MFGLQCTSGDSISGEISSYYLRVQTLAPGGGGQKLSAVTLWKGMGILYPGKLTVLKNVSANSAIIKVIRSVLQF